MAIKKLQNNFTTPEQSKRLLELGVPADSADCHYINSDRLREDNRGYVFVTAAEIPDFNRPIIKGSKQKYYIPCWSVGRLIEIAHICSGSTLSYKEEANEIQKFKEEHKCETLIEAVIMCIADAVSIGGINFSKLEE